jgi:transketolase N-terminal domain/subunit
LGCTAVRRFGSNLNSLMPQRASAILWALITMKNLPLGFNTLDAALKTSSRLHMTPWTARATGSLGLGLLLLGSS